MSQLCPLIKKHVLPCGLTLFMSPALGVGEPTYSLKCLVIIFLDGWETYRLKWHLIKPNGSPSQADEAAGRGSIASPSAGAGRWPTLSPNCTFLQLHDDTIMYGALGNLIKMKLRHHVEIKALLVGGQSSLSFLPHSSKFM